MQTDNVPIPTRPVEKLTRPLQHFFHIESAGGLVLAGATLIALIIANSPWAPGFFRFWEQTLTISIGSVGLSYPLWYWINDGLMAIFFFLIGLEIKRELITGELADPKRVILPAAAAVGGAALPALIFVAFLWGKPGLEGWAIPMATDIAFVVGAMALLGSRIPRGLKIFLLTLAIVDDIIAVSVIALFYSAGLKFLWLGGAIAGFGVIEIMKRAQIRSIAGYIIIGAIIWLCTLKSGVHPTVAGVFLGLATPVRPFLSRTSLTETLKSALARLQQKEPTEQVHERDAVEQISFASTEALSPLERLEHPLHPWVSFLIMPLFALANAGVKISSEAVIDPIALGVAGGLVVGKPIGIVVAAWLVIRAGWAKLPDQTGWLSMFGAGALAGIGFTMSLFVASLSMEGQQLAAAKMGVLVGSAVSIIIGMSALALRRSDSA